MEKEIALLVVGLAVSAMGLMTWLVKRSTDAFIKRSDTTIGYLEEGTRVKHQQVEERDKKIQEQTEVFHCTIDKFENTIARINDSLVPKVDNTDRNVTKIAKRLKIKTT